MNYRYTVDPDTGHVLQEGATRPFLESWDIGAAGFLVSSGELVHCSCGGLLTVSHNHGTRFHVECPLCRSKGLLAISRRKKAS